MSEPSGRRGIAADLLDFFLIFRGTRVEGQRRSLADFMREHPQHNSLSFSLPSICARLVHENWMFPAGSTGKSPPFDACYYSQVFDASAAEYGVYDFAVFGFPLVRSSLASAVRRIGNLNGMA